MTESKITLTDRLRREGRWPEAERFKQSVIQECQAQGMTRREAREHAWAATAAAYPPGESAGVESGGIGVLPAPQGDGTAFGPGDPG